MSSFPWLSSFPAWRGDRLPFSSSRTRKSRGHTQNYFYFSNKNKTKLRAIIPCTKYSMVYILKGTECRKLSYCASPRAPGPRHWLFLLGWILFIIFLFRQKPFRFSQKMLAKVEEIWSFLNKVKKEWNGQKYTCQIQLPLRTNKKGFEWNELLLLPEDLAAARWTLPRTSCLQVAKMVLSALKKTFRGWSMKKNSEEKNTGKKHHRAKY